MKIIGENLCVFVLCKDFLDITPKAWSKKEKIVIIKIKNSFSYDIHEKIKRQATGRKIIFASHISDTRLVSTICKEQLNNKKLNNPI